MPYDLDLNSLLRRFLDTVGAGRIIFGSDSSWFPRGFARQYLDEQFRACCDLGVSDEDMRLTFFGNAARLLGLGQEAWG